LPQQIERLWQQHDVAVFASLGLHDADDVLRAVDIANQRKGRVRGDDAFAPSSPNRPALIQLAGIIVQPVTQPFFDSIDPQPTFRQSVRQDCFGADLAYSLVERYCIGKDHPR
jgi:hypothetical protein